MTQPFVAEAQPAVGTSKGERILETAIRSAHAEELSNAAIDPITIITLVSTLIEAIRNCRNQSAAASHLQRGSALVYRDAYRRLLDEGYARPEARKLARNLQQQAAKLTAAEVQELVTEAKDVPVAPTGFWPLVIAFLFFLIPSVTQAGFWPLPAANLPAAKSVETVASWPFPAPTVTPTFDLGPDRIVMQYRDESELKVFRVEQKALEKAGWKFSTEPRGHVQLQQIESGPGRILKIEGGKVVREFDPTDRLDRVSLPLFWSRSTP